MRGWAVALVAMSAAIAALVIALIAGVVADSTTPITELEVGDCFDFPSDDAGTIETVETVACSEPHLVEVVHVGELPVEGRDYPDDAELFEEVDRACRTADTVVSEQFGLLPVAPTIDLWESFDGRFLCLAIPFGGEPVTGSAVAA